MRRKTYQDADTILHRFPRLVRAMRWAAILTEGEAVSALQLWQIGDTFAGEAVNHFGGIPAVLGAAIRSRHFVRGLRTKTRGELAYEEDCRRRPTYDDGTQRRPWSALDSVCRYSWERDPRPRDWSQWRARKGLPAIA